MNLWGCFNEYCKFYVCLICVWWVNYCEIEYLYIRFWSYYIGWIGYGFFDVIVIYMCGKIVDYRKFLY